MTLCDPKPIPPKHIKIVESSQIVTAKTTNPKMTIRDAKISDIRAMAEVSASAFGDEELFGQVMMPFHKEFPEDYITFFEHKIRSHWYDYNRRFIVGCDKESGKILGVAMWERQGKSGGLMKYDPRE